MRQNLFCGNGASAFWAALRFTSSSDSGMTRSDRIRLTMPNETAAQNAAAAECIHDAAVQMTESGAAGAG